MNSKKDIVGVLLSVYKKDNPQWLITTIDSLLSQTYNNIIILIGVDGAIDQPLIQVLNQFDQNPKIKVSYYKENRGLACVLNDLITLAKELECGFYARMDADDIAPSNRFELQIKYLTQHPEVDVVSGAVAEMKTDNTLTGKIIPFPLTHEECKKRFRYRDPLTHPGVMFRSSFFKKVKGYRNEYRKNQDTMLWLDGFLAGCIFANIEDVVVNFRVNEDLYKNRRGGWKQASRMLKNRIMINKAMHYDITAYLFAFGMFCITIMPARIRKYIYDNRP